MSETPTPETDAYIMQSYSPTGLQWRCFARKLERERDEARRDLDASEELHRRRFGTLRKELAASNLGAERNAKVNQGLCAKLAEAERERDEARRELAAVEALLGKGWSESELETQRERDEAMRWWKEAWEGWTQALDERNEAVRELSALKAKMKEEAK